MSAKVAVIGAGVAGLEAASVLTSMGFEVILIEKSMKAGGHAGEWHQLFPDRRAGNEITSTLIEKVQERVTIHHNKEITSIKPYSGKFILTATGGWETNADAVLIASGFELFDAHRKEEYGYGIYDHVITSADLERLMNDEQSFHRQLGKTPARIGFVHCVGSRDEKVGNLYCSKVCCVTAVKQAIEMKEMFPAAEVFCFYMDLRMFGRYYEELYKEAQEKHNIQFIRGRLSEAAENKQGGVVLRVEDTLLGKPLKITVDLLVLMAGMEAGGVTNQLLLSLNLIPAEDGFIKPQEPHLNANLTEIPGIFVAGTCTGPKTINESLNDARSAAIAIRDYIWENSPEPKSDQYS